jgi:hypothetical protein
MRGSESGRARGADAEEFGVSHFWVYMDLGGLDQRELRRSMERFATKVIPQFRGK